MKPPETILCTVDFSPHTPAVLEMGVRLARGFRAELILFHSVVPEEGRLAEGDVAAGPMAYGDSIEEVDERIRAVMEKMPENLVSWRPFIGRGDPVDALAAAVQETGADLIVATSFGLSRLRRTLAGTVVERVIRSIPRPVLVLPPVGRRKKTTGEIRTIVAACDLLSHPDPVAAYAWDMARHFQATLHLVHAMERPVTDAVEDTMAGSYVEIQEELRRRIQWLLRESVSDEIRHTADIRTAAEPGAPAEVLLDYVRRHAADLVAVGVRVQGAFKKLFIGSTTEDLVRRAPCAVLTLPQGALKEWVP